MSERRRRKCPVNENSDCDSEESGEEQPINNSSNQGSDGGNSEYESVDEEELADEDEAIVDGRGSLIPASGEVEDLKSLDHDEDRKNPQYIPKKGTFYEHDDRTMGEVEEVVDNVSEKSAPQDKETKKKVWKEDGKWMHDRFSVYDQSPKSREELVATYGYDIRNEEGPPRARRRRRYGRGPNKYTRNWEDMDAYSKPVRGGKADVRGGGKRGGRKKTDPPNSTEEEFPNLDSMHIKEEKVSITDETELEVHQQVTVQPTQVDSPKVTVNTPTTITETYDNVKGSKNIPVGDQGNRVYLEEQKREMRGTGRGNRSNRQTRPGVQGFQRYGPERNHNYSEGGHFMNKNAGRGRGEGKMRMPNRGGHTQAQAGLMQQNYQSKDVQDITEELKTVTITPSMNKEEQYYRKKNIDTRRNTIPPRLQESMRGNKAANHGGDANSVSKPKRYSSQRQRPLQDQMGQYHHPQGYYDQTSADPGFNKIYERANSSPGTGTPSPLALPAHAGPPSFVAPSFTTTSATTFPPTPRLFPSGTQPHLIGPPVAGPPIGGPPPVAGPGVTGPPVPGTVGGPPVTGPPFLPPENMINYAAGAPALVAAPHPPQFPAFQAFTPVSQQQPQEIYSNGVTYYNTQSQQHLPRINPVLQKRPKAAIPIIPPPDKRRPTRDEIAYEYGYAREPVNDYGTPPRETVDFQESFQPASHSTECVSEELTHDLESNEVVDPNGNSRSNIALSNSESELNIASLEQSPLQVSASPSSAEHLETSENEANERVHLEATETTDNDYRDDEASQTISEPSMQLINGEEECNISQETDVQVTTQSEETKSIPNTDDNPSEVELNTDNKVTDTPVDTT